MPMQETIPVKLKGNKRLTIQSLNAAKTAYENDPLNIKGLIELSGSFTINESSYPADDDPEFEVGETSPVGELTGNMRGFDTKNYDKIYPAVSGSNGIWFGEDLPVKRFGLMFDETVFHSDGEESINRYVIFNCRATNLPAIATATISNETSESRTIPLALAVRPLFYTKANGQRGRVLYGIVNSKLNPEMFAKLENGLEFPDEQMIQAIT